VATTKKTKETHHLTFEHQRPLRIVPLHPAPRAAAAAPKLTYRNGPLLTNVQVFAIFWGKAWQNAANSPLATQMNSFFDFILTSELLDQLSEYSVPGKTIGHGVRTGSANLITSEPGKSITDTAIQSMLQNEISSGARGIGGGLPGFAPEDGEDLNIGE